MNKTGFKAAIVFVLVTTVLAGQALAGWGGGRGRGGGPGWGGEPGQRLGRGMPAGPRTDENIGPIRPDRPGIGRGPFCPFCQRPYQRDQIWQGRGMGRLGRGFQGRGLGPCGRGFGRRYMMMQRWPMMDRWGQGFRQGRGGGGFQRRDMTMWGRGMIGRPGRLQPRGMGRPDQDALTPPVPPEDVDRDSPPTQPRGAGRTPGRRPGLRPGRDPNIDAPPETGGRSRRERPTDERTEAPRDRARERPRGGQ